MAIKTLKKVAKNLDTSHIIDYGGNGETIILLHGFLSSHHYWNKLAVTLTRDGFHVIAIDLIGFGDAHKPDSSNYDYKAHISHIRETIQRIAPPGPTTLIGHSMGALLAMRYALEFGRSVQKVILLHPPLYSSPEEARRSLRDTSILYRLLLDHPVRHAMWGSMQRILAKKMGRHTIASRERSLRNVIERAEGIQDINRITQPTLLILGSYDRPQYIKNVKKYLTNDNVTQKNIPTGHHSVMGQPALVHTLIRKFIQPSSS